MYNNLTGVIVGGFKDGAFSGIGGIMFSNAASFSINHIEANITDSVDYTEQDLALQFTLSLIADTVLEYRPNQGPKNKSSKNNVISNSKSNNLQTPKIKAQGKVFDLFGDVFNASIRLAYDSTMSSKVVRSKTTNAFSNPIYSFLR